MNKIIIVDDHSLFREGIKLLIENEGLGEVIAEAENGAIFLDILQTVVPDLVIMDIEMPVMNGLEATQKALKIYPDLKILVLTMLNQKANYFDMVNAGALGFVLKTSGKQEFEKAINSIMLGESYFSNELLRKIINSFGRSANIKPSLKDNLTDREIEVLQQICLGLSTEEIAEKLFISPKTVKSHKSKLLEKTACKNTPLLILFAIKNKIVQL